jgi:hypothetical protein
MNTWLIIAASIVVGILIGFASGYRTGQGQAPALFGEQGSQAAPATEGSSGRPFTESTVDGPVRLEEQPVVPVPDEAASAPAAAAPAPPAPDRRAARPSATSEPSVARPAAIAPATPVTGPGSLQVLSRPAGAQVILDGQVVGRTPLTIPDVSAGRHDVRLELPGFNRWATTVEVPAGKPARVAASLEQ